MPTESDPSSSSLIWLDEDQVRSFHARTIERFGGSSGIRDEGLLESAMARPRQHFHYGQPSLFELAAAYAVGIVKNHPFVDGNKRTAYLSADGFLTANGCVLRPPTGEIEQMMVKVADGTVDRDELASWIHQHADCSDQ